MSAYQKTIVENSKSISLLLVCFDTDVLYMLDWIVMGLVWPKYMIRPPKAIGLWWVSAKEATLARQLTINWSRQDTYLPCGQLSNMDDFWNFPEFKHAVVRQPASTVNNAIRDELSTLDIDEDKLQKEWDVYVQTLRDCGLEVTTIPPDDSLPDSLFVEDGCVVVGDTALITRPADDARRGETKAIEETLRKFDLKVHVIESETATLEGGDVLFTGKEIFCGESIKSNAEGFAILEETFPDIHCHSIFVSWPEYHLLGFVGFPAPGVLTVCDNDWGVVGWDDICEASHYTYKPVWIPDNFGNNCMYVNGTIIHTTEKQKPATYKVYEKEFADFPRVALSSEEVAKIDAALTCQSILF